MWEPRVVQATRQHQLGGRDSSAATDGHEGGQRTMRGTDAQKPASEV